MKRVEFISARTLKELERQVNLLASMNEIIDVKLNINNIDFSTAIETIYIATVIYIAKD